MEALLSAQLKNSCATHPAADAHSHEAIAAFAPLEFVNDADGQFRPGRAERVTQSNGPAIDVDRSRASRNGEYGKRLAREGLIQFHQINVFNFQAGVLSALGIAATGPMPMMPGGTPPTA